MWNDARTTNLLANTLAVLAVLVILASGVIWLAKRPFFNIAEIDLAPVQGGQLHYVTTASVRTVIEGNGLSDNFFLVNLNRARSLFETVPWVRHASVRRIWPDALGVSIEEQQPMALWNENQMLNTWGESFTANTGEVDENVSLPHFYGPDGSESLVVQRYAELEQWFAPLGLRVVSMTLNARYAWHVQLSNGLELELGRDPGADAPDPSGTPGAIPFSQRIERFVKAWPEVQGKLDGRLIKQVDLRYPNGFALTLDPASDDTSKNGKSGAASKGRKPVSSTKTSTKPHTTKATRKPSRRSH